MTETSRYPRYPEALLSVQQAGEMLGVSRATVFRLIAAGSLPVVKLGDRTLLRPEDLVSLVTQSLRQRPSGGDPE